MLALISAGRLYFAFCALGFALRFLLSLWVPARQGESHKGAHVGGRKPWLGPAGLAWRWSPILCSMLALLGPLGSLKWVDTFGVQILLYVLLGWGLNITVGLAGLLDLGYVAFYAVGAYAYALLAPLTGLSFWRCCRSPACLRPSGASASAFRSCGCAAITSPS